MASAFLKGILRHSVVININGNSYRLKYQRERVLPTERLGEGNEWRVMWGESLLSIRFCTNFNRFIRKTSKSYYPLKEPEEVSLSPTVLTRS